MGYNTIKEHITKVLKQIIFLFFIFDDLIFFILCIQQDFIFYQRLRSSYL